MIPGLADWALRGQRGSNDEDDNDNDGNNEGEEQQTNNDNQEALSPEEMRAQRLQRMELLQKREQEAAASSGAEPMDVDDSPPSSTAKPSAKKVEATTTKASASSNNNGKDKANKDNNSAKKKRKAEKDNDSTRKFQRKKEMLLRKVLNVVLSSAQPLPVSTSADSTLVTMDIGSNEISKQSIAEVLSNRVSLSPSNRNATLQNNQKSLMAYLADCHRKAAEELKSLRSSNSNNNQKQTAAQQLLQQQNTELMELLQEIQKQVVSYAATILIMPDLFELGNDSVAQLSNCLLASLNDLSVSITFKAGGPNSPSFYTCLVDELLNQDADALKRVVQEIVQSYREALAKCDSVLDNKAVPTLGGGSPAGDNSPLSIVSALTALCMHKKVAEMVTQTDHFLLPPPDTPAASEVVRPPANNPVPPAGGNASNRLLQLMATMANQQPSYRKRSGPGLEKETLLGLCLRMGIPTKNNAAFSPTNIMRQSVSAVESATSQQRNQLRLYQESCNQFLNNIVKAGKAPRETMLTWFTDALLVNVGASALRPDPAKVSSNELLLNMSVCLLKLCEPFVTNPEKHALIDPNFCSDPAAHKGVYTTTGDDAVARLGNDAEAMNVEYDPKNAFISRLFFLMARAVHLGLGSYLSQHENLLRNLSHLHWNITSRGGDLQSDPQFGLFISRQRSQEVGLFEEEQVSNHLRFLQVEAKVLFEMKDEDLANMPEDFVSDICSVLTSIAKVKPRLLRGTDVGFTFRLVVKLLSPKYAEMVNNYNLRAMLGDVLYELFLPRDGDRRESVPSSVYTDSRTNETYLISDVLAQETLAPSLLLLYGEVEHTGYYDKMSHRAKIASLIKYLWDSAAHRPAFKRITQNKESFIKFANGIMNETNTLIATVMQKLPEIREAQEKMKNTEEWGRLTEEQQTQISERLENNEQEVKHALPLCNKTVAMFGYLNTDEDIRKLFLLEELCSRLVSMLLHVLRNLVGAKGLELKVDNPEELDFKPKVMLRDLCYIFSLFASAPTFQEECAKSGGDSGLLRQALKTVRRLNLLQGEQLEAFESLPDLMELAKKRVEEDEKLLADAPDEFLDEILSSYMKDPVKLPSGHFVDRSTITQHLLNDPMDPFNRSPMTIDDVEPATELKEKMDKWLSEKRAASMSD